MKDRNRKSRRYRCAVSALIGLGVVLVPVLPARAVDGVLVGGSALITGCIISGNGVRGIKTGFEASLVIDNVVTTNVGYGLSGSSSTSYKGNVFQGNNDGMEVQVFNADEIDGNLCGSDSTCP
jgi:hypothetical protein